MQIEFSAQFGKTFRKLVSKRPEAAIIVMEKVLLFADNPRHPSLALHKLKGELKNYWAFSVEYDLRIVLEFINPDKVLFIVIGTHDEVY